MQNLATPIRRTIMGAILVLLAALLTASVPSSAPAVVQPAGPPGAIIKHMSNDPGLFSPFYAACGASNYPVDISNPGWSTANSGCAYASGVNVFGGEQLWCRPFQTSGATQLYWTYGWHPWPYSSSIECEVKAA